MLEVKATKTYREFLNENPNLFNGMREFAWDEDEQKYVTVPVKPATKKLIDDWFGTRIVCNDDNFERFFTRQFNLCALRYSQLARIELSSFDPLVSDYMEREAINNSNRTSASKRDANKSNISNAEINNTQNSTGNDESTSTSKRDANKSNISNAEINNTQNSTGNDESTRTPNITRTDASSRANNDSANDSKVGSSKSNSKDKAMNKVAPMSISYERTNGDLPNLDWSYATSQDQRENVSNGSSTETNTHEGNSEESYSNTSKETGTDKNVSNSTNTSTNNTTHAINGSETSKETGTSTETGDSKDREVRTGRGGLTPQEAFRTAVAYLKTSSAWDWFRKQLEECFLCIYDV